MELKDMSREELEARKLQIVEELEAPEADLDAIEEEVRSINERLAAIAEDTQKKEELRAAVAAGAGEPVQTFEKEERHIMTNEEVRATKEYAEAYKNYIIHEDDAECRALLTENVSGSVPVPKLVQEMIETKWDNDPILSRVNRQYVRGNYRVPFEISATGAVAHTEGSSAITEETLSLGIVELIPKNLKKMIRVSDEAIAMGGEEFLRFIYDELAYEITKKLSSDVVADISGASTSDSTTAVGVPKVTAAPAITTLPRAAANLSEAATNVCVIMNRLTEVEFISAYAQGNFAIDPFAGMTKLYSSALPAYSTATSNQVYAIVGDLNGEMVNYPEGDGVVIKYDDLSEAEKDLVKIVGRQYVAHGITKPGRFVNVAKPAAATT